MNNKLILGILGGVLGLGLIVAVAISVVTGGSGDDEIAFGDVTIEGEVLPPVPDAGVVDPAVGMTAASISGTDLDGNPLVIEPDGTPKVVLYLAHWCPHCQAEVPEVQAWLDAGAAPEGVDFYAISTLANRLQGNWPPQEWLADEGWTVPTMLDDRSGSASVAYGLVGTPHWVVLDGDNEVLFRIGGQIGTQGVATLFEQAAASTA